MNGNISSKGNKTSFPIRSPGVWIHPNNNALRIYMNTYENPLEYIDLDNIPLESGSKKPSRTYTWMFTLMVS